MESLCQTGRSAQREVSMEDDMDLEVEDPGVGRSLSMKGGKSAVQDNSLQNKKMNGLVDTSSLSATTGRRVPSRLDSQEPMSSQDMPTVKIKVDSFISQGSKEEINLFDGNIGQTEAPAIASKRESKVVLFCQQDDCDQYKPDQSTALKIDNSEPIQSQCEVFQPEDQSDQGIHPRETWKSQQEDTKPSGKSGRVVIDPDEIEDQDYCCHGDLVVEISLKKEDSRRCAGVSYEDKTCLRQMTDDLDEFKISEREGWHESGIILNQYWNNFQINASQELCWTDMKFLGRGGQGSCQLAKDTCTGFLFCVKKVPLDSFEKNEVAITADLDHPNIIKLYGVAQQGSTVFIFMEYIDGGNLSQVIEVNGSLTYWMALTFFRQVMEGLAYLEQQGILHEDIKGDNILVRNNKTIAIADFGLAQRLAPDHKTEKKGAKGTHFYLSPEKASEKGHNYASDRWAATGVLTHLLTGNHPWHSQGLENKWETYVWMIGYSVDIGKVPPPLHELPPGTPGLVKDLVSQGWRVDPDERLSARGMLGHPAVAMLDHYSQEEFVQVLHQYMPGQNDVDRRLGKSADVDIHSYTGLTDAGGNNLDMFLGAKLKL